MTLEMSPPPDRKAQLLGELRRRADASGNARAKSLVAELERRAGGAAVAENTPEQQQQAWALSPEEQAARKSARELHILKDVPKGRPPEPQMTDAELFQSNPAAEEIGERYSEGTREYVENLASSLDVTEPVRRRAGAHVSEQDLAQALAGGVETFGKVLMVPLSPVLSIPGVGEVAEKVAPGSWAKRGAEALGVPERYATLVGGAVDVATGVGVVKGAKGLRNLREARMLERTPDVTAGPVPLRAAAEAPAPVSLRGGRPAPEAFPTLPPAEPVGYRYAPEKMTSMPVTPEGYAPVGKRVFVREAEAAGFGGKHQTPAAAPREAMRRATDVPSDPRLAGLPKSKQEPLVQEGVQRLESMAPQRIKTAVRKAGFRTIAEAKEAILSGDHQMLKPDVVDYIIEMDAPTARVSAVRPTGYRPAPERLTESPVAPIYRKTQGPLSFGPERPYVERGTSVIESGPKATGPADPAYMTGTATTPMATPVTQPWGKRVPIKGKSATEVGGAAEFQPPFRTKTKMGETAPLRTEEPTTSGGSTPPPSVPKATPPEGGATPGGTVPPVGAATPDVPALPGNALPESWKSNFRPLVESLRRYGAGGQAIFDRFVKAESIADQMVGTMKVEAREAIHKVPLSERTWFRENFGHIAEGRIAPRSAAQAEAIKWWRKNAKESGEFSTKSGVRVLDEDVPEGYREMRAVKEYWPHQMKPEWTEAIEATSPTPAQQAMVQKFMDANVGKNFKSPAAVKEALRRWQDRKLKGLNPGSELPRKWNLPPESYDVSFEGGVRATEATYRTAAEQTAYRFRDEMTGKPRNLAASGAPQGDLGHFIAKIREELGPPAAEEAARIVEQLRHRTPRGPARRGMEALSAVEGAYHAATKYTGLPTAIVQAGQTAMTIGKASAMDVLKGVVDTIRSPKQTRRESLASGAADPVLKYGRISGSVDDLETTSKVAAVGRKVTDIGYSLAGTVDAASRTVATGVARRAFQAEIANLRKGGAAERAAATSLDTLRFTPEEIAELKATGGTEYLRTKYLQQFVRQTQGKATAPERLPSIQNPGAMMLARGKNFGIVQAQNAWDVAVEPVRRNPGDARSYLPAAKLVAASVLFGELIGESIEETHGPNASRPSNEAIRKDPSKIVERGIANLRSAGFMGILGDFVGKLVAANAKGGYTAGEYVEHMADIPVVNVLADNIRLLFDDTRNSERLDEYESAVQRYFHEQFRGPASWTKMARLLTPEGIRLEIRRQKGLAYRDVRDQLRERRRALGGIELETVK